MSRYSPKPLLVTPIEVRQALKQNVRPPIPLSSAWFMPGSTRSPAVEFQSGPRLPGARRFDVDAIANQDYSVPAREELGGHVSLGHMLPSARVFASAMGKMGIKRDDWVICYDAIGVFSSPRVAWTFRAMGHERVSVLDGGLPRWLSEGSETETGPPIEPPATDYAPFPGEPGQGRVHSYEAILANAKADAEERALVFDARSAERFHGFAPEPRPNLSSGHIPHSFSLPFTAVLSAPSGTDPSYQTMLPKSELEARLRALLGTEYEEVLAGKRPIVTTWMTAAVLWLALRILGVPEDRLQLYDESWTGYASRSNSIIVKSH